MLSNSLFPIDMSIRFEFYFICDVIADNITLDSCEISHKYLSFSVEYYIPHSTHGIYWLLVMGDIVVFAKKKEEIKRKTIFSEAHPKKNL